MPVSITPENEITLPHGGKLRLHDEAIRRDAKVLFTCDNPQCNSGKPIAIAWSNLDVADREDGLPAAAKSIVKLSTFDGQEMSFCGIPCLIHIAQALQTSREIHRVK